MEEAQTPVSRERPGDRTPRRRPGGLRLGAVVAAVLAVAFLVWLLASGGDDDTGPSVPAAGEPIPARAATREELVAVARTLRHPIYWAGPIADRTYELTRTATGRVFIRYLPKDVEAGDRTPRYLTVGTYPQANGYRAVRQAAMEPETVGRRATGGALIVYDRRRPRSVYFSFPGARFQVEVFDPTPGRARDLTYTGRIQPVG